MKEIVASRDLEIGMFVTDLDRPWIESPFMLQGFLVEDEDTLQKIRGLCRFVSVDRERSVGGSHQARAREDVASRVGRSFRGGAAIPDDNAPEAGGGLQLPDFLEILRLIRAGRIDALPRIAAEDLETVALSDAGTDAATPREVEGDGRDDPRRRAMGRLLGPLRGLFTGQERAAAAPGARAVPRAANGPGERSRVERELIHVAPVFVETQAALDKVLTDVRLNLNPDLGKLREGVEDMVRSVARNPDALLWLTRLKATDEYSYQHALDTSVHMMIFARSLGMGESVTHLLGMAGMLHDIGKVRLPPRLLHKNARLTPIEFEILKTHVDYSLAILRESPEASPELLEIVARHHERIDGSGYPAGLRGEAIGINAEIAGLVDSYAAMTGKRDFGTIHSTHAALEELIRLRGSRFRDTLVDQYVQCIGIYPVGSLVELNSGEVAVVIGQNRVRRLKPRVMVLLAPDKSANAYPPVIDLLYDPPAPSGEAYAIVRALPPNAYGIDPQEFYLS